jgi:hypothetical protein
MCKRHIGVVINEISSGEGLKKFLTQLIALYISEYRGGMLKPILRKHIIFWKSKRKALAI